MKHLSFTRSLILPFATGITFLAGCASTPPAPVFNPSSSIQSQADSFITANKEAAKAMSKVKRVFVTGCNVMLAENSSASSSTHAGLFGDVGNSSRADTKVSVTYKLSGVTDAQQQSMANDICANAENKLKAAGFDIIPLSEFQNEDTFKKLQASGRSSPFIYKSGSAKDGSTSYKVFAPTGYTVYDQRYIGMAAGLATAFKQAAGTSAIQMEGLLMSKLDASAVNINIMVDFAKLQTDGKGSMLANKNSASVAHEVDLGITGEVKFMPRDKLKCWKRFGKDECMLTGQVPMLSSKAPVTTKEKFYTAINDTTTTGDKIGSGISKGIGMAMALAGTSNSVSYSITRYQVEVIPASFTKVANTGVDGFLDMAFAVAKSKQ